MGLTRTSVGLRALEPTEAAPGPIAALAGNPNVGKSTLFNTPATGPGKPWALPRAAADIKI